jgi:hypothetical protein
VFPAGKAGWKLARVGSKECGVNRHLGHCCIEA